MVTRVEAASPPQTRVVVVEDEPSLREIMYRALLQEHYVV